MSQSYGNPSISPILAATDEILGTLREDQTLGTSISQKTSGILSAPGTLAIELDSDGAPQTITVSGATPYDIAADIQAKVRALTPGGVAPLSAFTSFTARYDYSLGGRFVLSSGTAGQATSACVVSGGTARPSLKLGATYGGTEAQTGFEVITWTVKYRFVFGAGYRFSSAAVVVLSSEMTTPTSLVELKAIADRRAAQVKKEQEDELKPYTSSDTSALNGPVTL